MKFAHPLIKATLIRRYKRFLADVRLLDGREVTAHVANPGSMMGLAMEGQEVWLEQNNDPKRKLKYSWKLACPSAGVFVNVDTGLPNKIVEQALVAGTVPELIYANLKREVAYSDNSRVDFLLTQDGRRGCYVEVKSATLMRQQGLVEFPDSVTKRGAKHMDDLAQMVGLGHRAVVLFCICRTDAKAFQVADDIDPTYNAAVQRAKSAGVEFLYYTTQISTSQITLGKALPLD